MTDETPQGPPAPRENPDLLDHAAAEQRLLQAFESGRLPHAWLITGQRGIGKATLAFRFARHVLAAGGESGAAGLFGDALPTHDMAMDPDHPVFRRVASGGHADLMAVARSVNPRTGKLRGEISVDDIRPLRAFLQMTAGEGGWRVVVVDAADEMNLNAANALLKVLEEPPPQALLLLVCHAPGRLLPTIRSRCCALPLGPLADDHVATLLARHAPNLPDDERAALVALAEGSIGRALALGEQGGLALYRDIVALLDGLPRLDTAKLHELGAKLARDQSGAAFRTGSELLIWWLARLIKAGSQDRLPPPVVAGEEALMRRLLDRRPLAQWLPLWDKLARLLGRAESANLDRKQVIVTAFLELESFAA